MDEEFGEVASGDVGADDADEVSLEEAYAAMGLDADGNRATRHPRASEGGDDADDDVDDDTEKEDDEAEDTSDEDEDEELEEEEDEGQADEDEDDEDSDPKAAQRRETPKQKYKRQRDEARASLETHQQREQELVTQGRKVFDSYLKVQDDYDSLQADFEDLDSYTKELEQTLKEEFGWEPDPKDVELRAERREKRKLERQYKALEKKQSQATQDAGAQEVERLAQDIHKQALAAAKKYRVDPKRLGEVAFTALQGGQMPDVERIAENLSLSDPKRAAAAKQRAKNNNAPRARVSGRRAARPNGSPSGNDTDDAVRFMERKLEREGRVLR